MGAIVSQITSLAIVYSIDYSYADQRKHQSSASRAFVWGIHREPVNSPHQRPIMRKMFQFDDVIMYKHISILEYCRCYVIHYFSTLIFPSMQDVQSWYHPLFRIAKLHHNFTKGISYQVLHNRKVQIYITACVFMMDIVRDNYRYVSLATIWNTAPTHHWTIASIINPRAPLVVISN